MGGEALTEYLEYLMADKFGSSLIQGNPKTFIDGRAAPKARKQVLRRIKENNCFVALDFEKNCLAQTSDPLVNSEPTPWTGSDAFPWRLRIAGNEAQGEQTTLGSIVDQCPEILFQPQLLLQRRNQANESSVPTLVLPEAIVQAIQNFSHSQVNGPHRE